MTTPPASDAFKMISISNFLPLVMRATIMEAMTLADRERYVLIEALIYFEPDAGPPLKEGQYTKRKSVPVIEMRSDK